MKRSTIPLGKNFGSKALSNVRMILSSASHTRMLLSFAVLVMMLFATQWAKADIVTTTYDFKGSIDAGNTTVSMGAADATYTNCLYFTQIGNVNGATRFAAQGDWILTEAHKMGLYSNNGGGRRFLVSNLYKGDIVTFDVVDVYGTAQTISLESTNATANGNTFTMTDKGTLCVNLTRYWNIKTITVQHDDAAVWGYDPAIETYDLYYTTDNIQSNNLKPAGFNLDFDDYEAQYLTNLSSGTALNDRIAISQVEYNGHYTPWQIDHGFKSLYNWHNISITNLVEGDRVVITWMGSAKFSSKAEQTAYNGCAAFKDNGNDGDFTEGEDTEISLGMSLEAKTTRWDYNANANIYTSYPYVITEDGHLDIALAADSKIVKVEIYADHQAEMVDKDNDYGTSTSYFNTTGQLEAKHHIVPGGLHVYIGNDDDKEHAEVVMSDKGPVSFVYDHINDEFSHHYKMARQSGWGRFNVWDDLPVTGTFYKFVPEVSGKMWVKFKASSVNYRDYGKAGNAAVDNNGTPNEVTNNVSCPYYLMVVGDNNKPSQVESRNYSNGADGFFGVPNGNPSNGQTDGITVERGKTYYLYGWWDLNDDGSVLNDINNHACGIAELLEVTFLPNQLVEPLAKWVESGTTSDGDLATVKGYNTVRIKKKSSNIASCEPYIEGGKLKIRNITFVDPNKGGGTILIKIGDPNIDGDPVFAYTIAYDAGYNEQTLGQDGNGTTIKRSEGHTWNFSENPLKALQWNNKNSEADVVDFGTYFNNFFTAEKDDNGIPTNGVNNQSFLYYETNTKDDWTFNYRVKKNGQFHDPRFLNNWDMEGDNADMMWDTEGIIIKAGSTQSCIFNEFGDGNIHSSNADPDRYVGFLEGGEFIIPQLKKDDRVIIYMGSGEGSGTGAMEFHITNALDAMHNPIASTDSYHAGGSMWNNAHGDLYYRGCYHFFAAADGDMKFTMSGGSMCKLYSIKIYRGEREDTNAVQEDGKGYTIFASKDQDGNVVDSETNTWNIHYRGKGETIADGTGKFNQENEIIAHSGNITHYANSDLVRVSNQGVSYTNQGEIGMLRVRVKCMEYNHNYVTDFADRNMTLALHETKSYPYTWDFMDIDGFSSQAVEDENDDYNELPDSDERSKYDPKGRELSMWDENGSMVLYGPTWGYTNENMIFENSKGIGGNQLYAGGDVIPETKGLWWYFDNNDALYSGCMQIASDGLHLMNNAEKGGRGWWNYKMVVPDVPAGAAVYLRMARDLSVPEFNPDDEIGENNIANSYSYDKDRETGVYNKNPYKMQKYQFGYMSAKAEIENSTNCKFYQVKDVNPNATDGKDDYIVAIYNSGAQSNLTFTLNGWTLKKLSISQDPKAVNTKGWTSESRTRNIDAALTAYLTGKDMKTYFAGQPNYKNRTLVLTDVGSSVDNHVMPANRGCVIFNATDENKANILNDGFHLFVPDMHDTEKLANAEATVNSAKVNMLKPQLTEVTHLPEFDDEEEEYTNYVLSYKYYQYDSSGNYTGTGVDGPEMFYRVANTGIGLRANSAYLTLPTSEVKPANWDSVNHAKYSFVFADYDNLVFDISGIATDIEAVDTDLHQAQDGWYNLNGQKLKGKPSANGLYIVNGKKVLVK